MGCSLCAKFYLQHIKFDPSSVRKFQIFEYDKIFQECIMRLTSIFKNRWIMKKRNKIVVNHWYNEFKLPLNLSVYQKIHVLGQI